MAIEHEDPYTDQVGAIPDEEDTARLRALRDIASKATHSHPEAPISTPPQESSEHLTDPRTGQSRAAALRAMLQDKDPETRRLAELRRTENQTIRPNPHSSGPPPIPPHPSRRDTDPN